MSKLVILTGLALVLGTGLVLAGGGGQNTMSSGRPSAVLTPERCSQLWKWQCLKVTCCHKRTLAPSS